MEYAKDIILNYEGGQETKRDWRKAQNRRKSNKTEGIISNILDKLLEHKMVATVVSVTVIFMVLDMFLISSFIDLLTKM